MCTVPTVTLATDRATIDSNSPSATLTASISSPLCPGQYLTAYNDLGARVFARDAASAQAFNSFGLSVASNQTRVFTAYVSSNAPATGPPSSLATSSPMSVQHLGWIGSVELSTNRGQTDANAASATLTVTLDRPLVDPYQLTVYDDLGTRILLKTASSAGTLTSFSFSVAPGNNLTRVYTAYVAQDAPTIGPPVNDVRATSETSVGNAGWLGTLELASDRDTVTAAQPSATLTITLDRPLAGPYVLTLYDSGGSRLVYKTVGSAGTLTTFSASAAPLLGQSRTYTAYVAQDGSSAPPTSDIRALASITFTSGQRGAEVNQGIDLTWLEAQLAGLTDAEIVLQICSIPGATYLQGSSVCDQGLAFSAARAAGLRVGPSLARAASVAAVGGGAAAAALLWHLADLNDGVGTPAPPAPPAAPGAVPAPAPFTAPAVRGNPVSYQDSLAELYLERAASTGLTLAAAQTAAARCVWMVNEAYAKATSTGAPDPFGGESRPCENRRILRPGSDNPATTQHDWEAIATRNPLWVQLTYVPRSERLSYLASFGLTESWYNAPPPDPLTGLVDTSCALPTPIGQACHEFPYLASGQSGPAFVAGPPGAKLQFLNRIQNENAGRLYGAFVVSCITSKGLGTGTPFLLIPMSFPGAPSTKRVC
ncbi:MAG: hypothetical protein U0R69_00340 [Gaiellales bacterium]